LGYPLVIVISLAYLLLLFAIAYWADRRTSKGKSLVTNPYIYALSLAVYCTAWTYYGSVGRAASSGIGFLPIYLGPTLSAPLWIMLLRKMITISKAQRITSVADFISARYGKSEALGVIATLIAVLGIIPYIALQLKAIVFSFEILSHGASTSATASANESSFYYDTAFYVTIVLALFSILFGTRKLEANERHEGMVAAIAFESILKLVAFLSVGIFVTYVLFDGAADIFERVSKLPEISNMFLHDSIGPVNWFVLIFISMTAILMLPRQFHIAVVENQSIGHVNKAMWLFPLYMLIINIFVLPIAAGGLLIFPNGIVEADTFVLDLPLLFGQEWLATFAFIGGLSAGSSMVIVSSIGLSIMISNNLIMPFLLRGPSVKRLSNYDLSDRILNLRRLFIAVVMLLSYGYFKLVGTKYSLVSIGLISFTAVAQFAPAALIGMYWKGATRLGAILGLSSGFIIWAFTLPIPNLVEAGFISQDLMQDGLFGISLLRPHALFGLEGLDPITHAVFWSMFFNLGFFIGGSLYSTSNATA
jgi:Na+/proline symporter